MALMVIIGLCVLSKIYNNRRDGRAIRTKIIAGRIVQIISIIWPSRRNRWVNLLNKIEISN